MKMSYIARMCGLLRVRIVRNVWINVKNLLYRIICEMPSTACMDNLTWKLTCKAVNGIMQIRISQRSMSYMKQRNAYMYAALMDPRNGCSTCQRYE